MDSAPGIPTDMGEYEYTPDPSTQALNVELNSVIQIPYGTPSFNRGSRMATGDEGYRDMGYKMRFVDNQVTSIAYYEAPEPALNSLSYSQQIYNSTLVQKQVNGQLVYSSLRAPAINEGY